MLVQSLSRTLARYCKAPRRNIVDLGSGDGMLMLKIARRFSPGWRNVGVILLDHQNTVSAETRDRFSHLQWHAEPLRADVFDFLMLLPPMSSDAIIVAPLIATALFAAYKSGTLIAIYILVTAVISIAATAFLKDSNPDSKVLDLAISLLARANEVIE
jgi:hypothetical protein